MKFSVVIPSKTATNIQPCVDSIIECEPAFAIEDIVIVDDGIHWASVPSVGPVSVRFGVKPFVFAKNANIGLRVAFDDGADVAILMNDDALLKTTMGFTSVTEACEFNPEYGLIAAVTNSSGNPNQQPKNKGLRDERRMVCFVCVAIPRTTFERVGPLDERYIHYGMDDDDYSLRVLKAGLKLGVYDGCFVDHKTLPSSYRGDPKRGGDFRQNMQIFIDKWGHDNWGLPAAQARQKWAVRR